jgi:hypothetical protein
MVKTPMLEQTGQIVSNERDADSYLHPLCATQFARSRMQGKKRQFNGNKRRAECVVVFNNASCASIWAVECQI